jgi:hypothetical protein
MGVSGQPTIKNKQKVATRNLRVATYDTLDSDAQTARRYILS